MTQSTDPTTSSEPRQVTLVKQTRKEWLADLRKKHDATPRWKFLKRANLRHLIAVLEPNADLMERIEK